jgi:SWI/SNF-related matrix-associated actin-dependent regulator of chromatin subfamily A-like protein 1
MFLDYNPATEAFILRVPRNAGHDIRDLMVKHGLDLSIPASTASEAVLFTHEPYAAVTFISSASGAAKAKLKPLADLITLSWKPDSKRHFRLNPGLELRPFQGADLEYALARTHCLIADEPGLGKTIQAIVYANEIDANRVLVICPANIRMQWAKKIQEWSTMPWQWRVAHVLLHSKHGVSPEAHWNIVSYDLARTEGIGRALAGGEYDLLILDEAHYLKTIDSRRTRAIFGGGEKRLFEPIVERCSRVLALTGTPLPNRPREAYTLARALCFDAIDWMSEDRFNGRFNPSKLIEIQRPDGTMTRHIDERTGRHAELQNRLRANFMVRHLKRDVMPQLKLPVFDIVRMEETSAIKQALAAESLLDIDPDTLEGADAIILGHIAAVRKQMGVAMAPSVSDYVEMLLLGGEQKLVLFGWHIEVLNILQARLAKHGVVRIDGSTSSARREANVKAFIENPAVNIILGNMQSMGVGTDGLQHVSNHALICEPDWTPANNVQAFDRLNRDGQMRTVQGDILVAPGSIAERVLAGALRKMQTTHLALDAQYTT